MVFALLFSNIMNGNNLMGHDASEEQTGNHFCIFTISNGVRTHCDTAQIY